MAVSATTPKLARRAASAGSGRVALEVSGRPSHQGEGAFYRVLAIAAPEAFAETVYGSYHGSQSVTVRVDGVHNADGFNRQP
jgi:hypothetical protein